MSAPELYVYYRLQASHAEAALTAFRQASAGCGVRLLQKNDEAGLLTWMETYATAEQQAHEPDVAAALAAFVEGARHHERFAPLQA
ncbi:DUF4936 family protein [Pelomonas sp. V22]|uniref:DUF4936 family protein n=1 Tax=Pelomonas sp. V22 TaxID=2822139 RepID=UPI0024A9AF8C|nr:DUF4936 family protein [Pelomonas sp. V22]MDI4631449.1 DUF4936 family protein [Pelomonas sp. V22]